MNMPDMPDMPDETNEQTLRDVALELDKWSRNHDDRWETSDHEMMLLAIYQLYKAANLVEDLKRKDAA